MELSNCSSLATISLGSVKTLSSKLKGEITNNEITQEENKESSPSSKKHPGRFLNKKGRKAFIPLSSRSSSFIHTYSITIQQQKEKKEEVKTELPIH